MAAATMATKHCCDIAQIRSHRSRLERPWVFGTRLLEAVGSRAAPLVAGRRKGRTAKVAMGGFVVSTACPKLRNGCAPRMEIERVHFVGTLAAHSWRCAETHRESSVAATQTLLTAGHARNVECAEQ